MATILLYLWKAVLTTLIQIGIFLIPGLILAFLMNYLASLVERRALASMGRGWYLGLFGWLGTCVHELGHAFFCLIFGHKITKMRLFDPDPETGTLGYVEHSYKSGNIYQLTGNFFIGIGPILLGTLIIFLMVYFLMSINPFQMTGNFQVTIQNIQSWNSVKELLLSLWVSSIGLLGNVFAWPNFATWQLYIFIYLAFAIGSSITLSPPDIKIALKGFWIILILILLFNLATAWAETFSTNLITGAFGYFRVLYTAVFFTLVLNLVVALLILLPLALIGRVRAKTA